MAARLMSGGASKSEAARLKWMGVLPGVRRSQSVPHRSVVIVAEWLAATQDSVDAGP